MRMMMMMLALGIASPVAAQTALACTAAAPLPPELVGWAKPVAAKDGSRLAIGQAGDVALGAAATFAVPPEKAPVAGSFGASVGFTIAATGTYRVALDSGVWIDVVRDGEAVASKAHGHGPACSPVKKMVDFALTPGRYAVQLSGAKAPSVRVLVARVP